MLLALSCTNWGSRFLFGICKWSSFALNFPLSASSLYTSPAGNQLQLPEDSKTRVFRENSKSPKKISLTHSLPVPSHHQLTFHLSREPRPLKFHLERKDSVEILGLITAQLKNVFPVTSLE